MGAPGGDEDRLASVDDRQTENVANGPAGDVERQPMERAAVGLDVEPAEPAPGHPAAANVAGGDRAAAVVGEGEVARSAVGRERRLADVEPLEGMTGADKPGGGIDKDDLGAGGTGDGDSRAVRGDGDEAGEGAGRNRLRGSKRVEIDRDDRGRGGQGNPRGGAVGGEGDVVRLEAEMDPAGLGEAAILHTEHDKITRLGRDRDEAILAPGCDGAGTSADGQLVGRFVGKRVGTFAGQVDKRHRPGGPVGSGEPATVP